MAAIDSGSKRNLTVLAVVVACFAVLWPKIFYPMIQSIIFPKVNDEEEALDSIKKLNFNYMLHPQMREAMGEARPPDKLSKEGNRAMSHPSLRYTSKPQSKGGGVANLVIPAYTIGIIVFFIYTLLKMGFNKQAVANHTFSRDAQKLACVRKRPEIKESVTKPKESPQDRKTQRALEQYGKDKVLTALKTIILEMEDFQSTFGDSDSKLTVTEPPVKNKT